MSTIFATAARQWRTVRAEFENYREGAYLRAETACNGALLNERGKRAGINAYSLFIGPEVRALAYASEELVEHWRQYPRMTFAQFEAETFDVEDGAA